MNNTRNFSPAPTHPVSRQYIGARYVPIFAGEWDITKEYEPLMIVMYNGSSYTSRTYIPVGVEITDNRYWALTGNYNAQLEAYRHEVQVYTSRQREILVNTINEMIETDLNVGEVVRVLGYYQANDGGASEYIIANSMSEFTQNIELNNGTYAQLIINDTINVKSFGAKGRLNSGNFDDSQPINEALELAHLTGDIVVLDGDTFIIKNPIIIDSFVEMCGVSKNKTIIKLHNNANCNIIESKNFNVLLDADTSTEQYQPQRITLHDFKIVGNSHNNVSGNGIALFATACTIHDIWLTDITDNGMYLAMRDAWVPDFESSEIPEKQASVIHDIDIYSTGEHGIYADGVHDNYYENVVVCNASQKQDNTYDGVHLTNGTGGRFVHYHGWSATQGFRDRYSLYHPDNAPLEISDSHLEGSKSGVIRLGGHALVTNCRFYVAYSEKMITLGGNMNSIINCAFQPNTDRNTHCIKFENNSNLNRFDCHITSNILFADEVESGGKNIYTLQWFGSQQSETVPCPIANIKPTSILMFVSNYQGYDAQPNIVLNGSVNVVNNISQKYGIINDPASGEAYHVHDERYVIAKSNANDCIVALQTSTHRIGRIITVVNKTTNTLRLWTSNGCTLNGVETASDVASRIDLASGDSVNLIKVGEDVWFSY